VEHLNAAKIHGHAVDDETARWMANLDDVLADKLAAVGLISRRERATLAAFIDGYISGRTDVKGRTVAKYRTTRGYLVDYFGEGKPLREITPGDADEWRLDIAGKVTEENTVRKHIAVAKVFFNAARKRRLILESPFDGQASAIQANPKREFFITRDMADRVLSECTDAEWRLIFVLSRYGGLRCPSEHLRLRWVDVDWERERFTVHAPKTEHHSGKGTRVAPMFPEVKEHLEAVFDAAPEGTEYVINRYRSADQNLRTQLERIVRRAGLEPWPKLFQNLRATRQTELEAEFPLHVVCRWLGNSPKIAAKHYLQVTDEHFDKALQKAVHAVQNPVQHPAADSRSEPQKTRVCDSVLEHASVQVAGAGLEPARGIPLTGF
jgi:integrase